MIRRLIILLLIVGCDDSTESEDEIKEVSWIIYNSNLYWTEVNDAFIELIQSSQTFLNLGGNIISVNECEGMNEEGAWNPDFIPINCNGNTFDSLIYVEGYMKDGVELEQMDSVRNITHFVEPNYFEIIETIGETRRLFPEDYEVFKYEYK